MDDLRRGLLRGSLSYPALVFGRRAWAPGYSFFAV
jgi:hypothetical protein